MPRVSLVLTVIGPDRPGLVEKLAATVAQHQGNWLESRMAHLAGQFAGILRVEAPSEQADALRQALTALSGEGLQSLVEVDRSTWQPQATPTLRLDLVGHDRPGIVREVTAVLASHSVNVEELHTEIAAAANTGQPLFRAVLRVQLPPGGSPTRLQEALEGVAADMMVDVKSQA